MGLAFRDAGFEIAGAWDFDKFAVQTYRENVWPGVEQRDIKELAYKDIPRADVWAFGFPCQDLSVAGKRRGLRLECLGCGMELAVSPEGYEKCVCPGCGGGSFRAASRSGLFFEVVRLLEETGREAPGNLPAIIIAENVKGLRPFLPVLEREYARLGYTAHARLFNSKFWGVAQNRERYAVVGTRDGLGLEFSFPEECRDQVPRLSGQLEREVDGKYYLPEWKQEAVIAQAAERVMLKNCHACIAPDYVSKKQRGPRARAEDEPMFTLTVRNLQGVIIREDAGTDGDVRASGCAGNPDGGCGGGRLRVRRLTPKEYGILQAFPMDGWKQVVSDSQAYRQFGNAVTVTVFSAVAAQIREAVLQAGL